MDASISGNKEQIYNLKVQADNFKEEMALEVRVCQQQIDKIKEDCEESGKKIFTYEAKINEMLYITKTGQDKLIEYDDNFKDVEQGFKDLRGEINLLQKKLIETFTRVQEEAEDEDCLSPVTRDIAKQVREDKGLENLAEKAKQLKVEMEIQRQGTIGRSKQAGISANSPILIELQNKIM